MEIYDLGAKRIFPPWKNHDQPAKGVCFKGTNMTSRATLGLSALYSTVGADASPKRARLLVPDVPPCQNGPEGVTRGPYFPRENTTRLDWTNPSVTTPLLGYRYRYISTIGTGTFADVVRAEDTFRLGRSVAIKVVNLGCETIGIRELRFMRLLGSVPHAESRPVVRLLDALTFRGHVCLVLELLDGTLHPYTRWNIRREVEGDMAPSMRKDGSCAVAKPRSWGEAVSKIPGSPRFNASLSDLMQTRAVDADRAASTGQSAAVEESVGGLPTYVIRHVALQLVGALLLLHDKGLIHTDIKPQNLLLGIEGEGGTSGSRGFIGSRVEDFMRGVTVAGLDLGLCSPARLRVKLCDFGNTIHRSETSQYYHDFDIQTLPYRAPEVMMGVPFGAAIDTWSVGVILLELLIGHSLFHTAGSRAALLRQTMCAFGPLPLRRFRVGRYFSEYFNQDHSLKVLGGDEEGLMGCCACCWVGEVKREGGVEDQLRYWSCSGSCAQKCGFPNLRAGTSGITRAAEIGDSLPGNRGAAFPALRKSSAPERPSWQVAHAHLCRLLRLADAVSPVVNGPAAKEGSSTPGSFRGNSSVSHGIARHNPHLLCFLARMLCLDPDERLTPLQALAHPFFSEILPFTVPVLPVVRAVSKVVKAEEAVRIASSITSGPGTPGLRSSPNDSTTGRRCDGNAILSDCQSWGVKPKLSKSLPRPLPTNSSTNHPISALGSTFQDSGCELTRAKCGLIVTPHTKEIYYGVTPSSSDLGDMRGAIDDSPTPLCRLAETAEALVRQGGNGTQQYHREGECGSGTSSAVVSTTPHRNVYANSPILAASKSSPPRSEICPAPQGIPTNLSRLSTRKRAEESSIAPLSDPSVRHSSDAARGYHRDGGCGGKTSGALTPMISRRDHYVKAPFLAESEWRASLSSETRPAPEIPIGQSMKQPTIPSVSTLTAADRVATPGKRPRNRFLTPAILAKLNPGLRDRITEAMTTAESESVKQTDTTSARTPAGPRGHDESPEKDKPHRTKKLKAIFPRAPEKQFSSMENKSSSKERHQQSRRSTRGKSTRSGRGRSGTANGAGRKISTPRRAAIAAGVALLRSRNEDAEADR